MSKKELTATQIYNYAEQLSVAIGQPETVQFTLDDSDRRTDEVCELFSNKGVTKKRERLAIELPELLTAVAIKHSELQDIEEGKGNYDDPEQRADQLEADLLDLKDAMDAKVEQISAVRQRYS